jgi:hypothetical protein
MTPTTTEYLICTVTGTLHAVDCTDANRASAIGPIPEFAGLTPDAITADLAHRQRFHHLCGHCLSSVAVAKRLLAARLAERGR